jgi:hypothetical protein
MLSKPVEVRKSPPIARADLVAMLEIAAAEGALDAEAAIVHEELVARRDVDLLAKEGDPPQPAVPAAAREVDVARVPVDHLPRLAAREVDEIDAAVALALAGAADDGGGDELRRRLHAGLAIRLSSASSFVRAARIA